MIRHIVMYWFKNKDEETLEKAKRTLLSMKGRIEGMLSIEVGKDIMGQERSCELCLCELFESREALNNYLPHPVHQPVKAFMHSVIKRSCSADFEVDA